MKDVEIVSIGDELLRGIVRDTNLNWLAVRLTARGARVTRGALLPDRPEIVAEELKRALERAPALIVTQGGLGPTDDDRTREAVALATGRPLDPHADAEKIVRRRYRELHEAGAVAAPGLTPARLRMTLLPRGATALDNQIGGAPGVLLPLGATTIACLPGVPPELEWIYENSLAPFLDELLGPGGLHEWTAVVTTHDESSIAEALAGVQARHPLVYVKSRAKAFDSDEAVRLTLTASAGSDLEARALVDAARSDARRALGEAGVGFESDD